jgi:hypothetical protein
MERRESRIRLIRQKMTKESFHDTETEHVSNTPEAHHHIGISENWPLRFSAFLQSHSGDPAIVVGLYL